MKKLTVDKYSDPGHGWIRIKKEVLDKLGIADKISSYSYERNKHVYLEEDNDGTTLRQTLEAKGVKLQVHEHNSNKQSKIRSYKAYSVPTSDKN